MTSTFQNQVPHSQRYARDHAPYQPSTSLRIVSLVLFAGFSIPVTIVALVQFWPAGLALGIVIAVQWSKIMGLNEGTPLTKAVDALKPQDDLPEVPKSSGNASFDAYRIDLLNRLEAEQSQFESFLSRLRDAKDKTEFDQFMEDRAKNAKVTPANQTIYDPEDA